MSRLTGRQLALIVGGVLAIALVTVGVFGLIRGPGGQQPSALTPPTVQVIGHGSEPQPGPATPARRLPKTTNPVSYANAVAVALFDWDTTSGYLATDYSAAVLADADPSGEETAGLVTDVATYLPSSEEWLTLGAMDVVQTINIDRAYVPLSWSTALKQAHGQIRPGTTAVTIDADRHRTGMWHGEPAMSTLPVSFTVFVACRPAFDRCHLLRLSQLDNPLR